MWTVQWGYSLWKMSLMFSRISMLPHEMFLRFFHDLQKPINMLYNTYKVKFTDFGSFSLQIPEQLIVWTFRLQKNAHKLVYWTLPSLVPADSSKENPYEDIELESQCSQQSLPSSPGADTTKVPAAQAKHNTFHHKITMKIYWSIISLSTVLQARLLQAEFRQEL